MSVPDYYLGRMSVEEYLRSEETSPIRREFVNGEVFAMTGSTLRHNAICTNLLTAIRPHLKGGPCRAFIEAVKVRIDATNCFYYPDLSVSCTPTDMTDVYIKTPVLIVEVLSPSTAPIDKREKLVSYLQIPTLNEYVLVHQDKRIVTVHRRDANGQWGTPVTIAGKGDLELHSMPGEPLIISLDDVYEGADWGEAPEGGYQVREAELEYAWY